MRQTSQKTLVYTPVSEIAEHAACSTDGARDALQQLVEMGLPRHVAVDLSDVTTTMSIFGGNACERG